MKTQSSRRAHGFTLVELLVVIAIIAVLAGAGFAAGNAAIQKAKKTTAMATCVALESAVNNFYTEYGAMPADPIPTSAMSSITGTGLTMIKVLLGSDDAESLKLNPRKIKFLSVKEGKKGGPNGGMNGLLYEGTSTSPKGLYDPWGGPYKIMLDDKYADIVKPEYTPAITLNGRKAAVWSLGADGTKGSGGKNTDDVVTWNK